MFIGHYAVGFASKRFAPRASLAWFVAGATLLDLLFPLFVILGWESARFVPADTPFLRISLDHYPWTHSLLMAVVWSVLFALLCWAVTRARAAALVAGAAVFSHWVLDLVTHSPDMPLLPGGSERVGLGLWHSTAGTVAVEGLMFVAGVWIYAKVTRARDGVGRWAWWGLVAFLALSYAGNLVASAPPAPKAYAWAGLGAGLLLVAWAWWVDRHRELRSVG
jgi:membrane-bound metal-dependent hydrolase YbcI (DUF457 family)